MVTAMVRALQPAMLELAGAQVRVGGDSGPHGRQGSCRSQSPRHVAVAWTTARTTGHILLGARQVCLNCMRPAVRGVS